MTRFAYSLPLLMAASALLAEAASSQTHRWGVRYPTTIWPAPFFGQAAATSSVSGEILVYDGVSQTLSSWNGYTWTATGFGGGLSLTAPAGAEDLANNDFHIVSGPNNASPPVLVTDHWQYNVAGGTWTFAGAVPFNARQGHQIVSWPGGLFLFGGFDGTNYYNDTWVWSAAGWAQLSPANSPTARCDFGMAFDGNQTTYLFGGFDGTNVLGDLWQFTVASGNWTQLIASGTTPAPRQRAGLEYVPVYDVVVMGGGQDATSTALSDVFEHTPGSGAWSQIASMYYPMSHQRFCYLPARTSVEAMHFVSSVIPFSLEPVPSSTSLASIALHLPGCNTAADPHLSSDTLPAIGTTYVLDIYQSAGTGGVITLDTTTVANPPACALHTGTAITIPFTITGNVAQVSIAVPNDPSLVGTDFFQQAVTALGAGVTYSNSLRVLIGY